MGKLVKKVPKTEYVNEIDWELLAKVAFTTIGWLVVAAIAFAFTFHVVRWVVRKPYHPQVITKVVHESALTAAQNAYIKQCESQDQHPGDGESEPGIPDVHSNTWTCTYGK